MKLRVLVVEDEMGIQRLVQAFLAPYAVCEQAMDGGEGFRKFAEALGTGRKYDLIILDIMMPVIDGQKLLERIRALERDKNIPRIDGVKVIMLTALDETKDVIASYKTGCDAYLPKPFEELELIREVEDLQLIRTGQ